MASPDAPHSSPFIVPCGTNEAAWQNEIAAFLVADLGLHAGSETDISVAAMYMGQTLDPEIGETSVRRSEFNDRQVLNALAAAIRLGIRMGQGEIEDATSHHPSRSKAPKAQLEVVRTIHTSLEQLSTSSDPTKKGPKKA
jgi:hypothetical protein